jgi:peptidoglycan/LPS O-acetylase OafA/YrhL
MIMNERNALLDGWRGLSVLSVVSLHLFFYHWPQEFVPLRGLAADGQWLHLAYQAMLRPLQEAGALGVPVFFLISGYIITTLLLREEARRGDVSIAAFYVRRVFRIVPALAIFLLALLVLDALGVIESDPRSHAASAAFACNIWQCDWWHAHLWSLAVEEQFYLAWPVLFLVLARRRIELVLALVVAFFLLSLEFEICRSFLYISIGVLFAIDRDSGHKMKLPAAAAWACGVFLLAGSFIPGTSVLAGVLAAAKPFVLAGLFFASFESRVMRTVLAFPPLVAVGRASYGLYLWQQLFTAPPGKQLIFAGDWQLLLLPTVVFVLYRYVELPLIAKGRGISDRLQDTPFKSRPADFT